MLQNLITILFDATILLAMIGAIVAVSISHLIHLRQDLVDVTEKEDK